MTALGKEMSGKELADYIAAQRDGRREQVWDWLSEHDPKFMQAYNVLASTVFGYDGAGEEDDSSLGVKVKELMGMAIMASQRDWERFPHHMRRVLQLGVSEREIVETLEVAALYGGSPGMRMGIEIMLRMKGEWKEEPPVIPPS